MNPTKMLIAQRLDESEREVRAIVGLMAGYTDDPHWARPPASWRMRRC